MNLREREEVPPPLAEKWRELSEGRRWRLRRASEESNSGFRKLVAR